MLPVQTEHRALAGPLLAVYAGRGSSSFFAHLQLRDASHGPCKHGDVKGSHRAGGFTLDTIATAAIISTAAITTTNPSSPAAAIARPAIPSTTSAAATAIVAAATAIVAAALLRTTSILRHQIQQPRLHSTGPLRRGGDAQLGQCVQHHRQVTTRPTGALAKVPGLQMLPTSAVGAVVGLVGGGGYGCREVSLNSCMLAAGNT